jgi:hypothetical protein
LRRHSGTTVVTSDLIPDGVVEFLAATTRRYGGGERGAQADVDVEPYIDRYQCSGKKQKKDAHRAAREE